MEGLGKCGMGVTFINFLPSSTEKQFTPAFYKCVASPGSLNLYYYCCYYYQQNSAEGKYSNWLHLASPSKQRRVFGPQRALMVITEQLAEVV